MAFRPIHAVAARAALKLSVRDLAAEAKVAVKSVINFENGRGVAHDTVVKLETYLRDRGVDFIDDRDGRIGIILLPNFAPPKRQQRKRGPKPKLC